MFRTLFFLLLAAMAGLGALMLQRQGDKAAAAENWRRTEGTVLASGVDQRAARSNKDRMWEYKAIVRYRYTADGRLHESIQRRFPEPGYSQEIQPEQRIAERYPAGSKVTVYVNPANPAESCLEPGRHWTVWIGMALAGAVALFALWMAWRSGQGVD